MSKSLLPVDMAIEQGLRLAKPIGETEVVPLTAAIGRILETTLSATAPQPLFDNSAMDGYAVRLAEFPGAGPWTLAVTGRVAAGSSGFDMPTTGACRIFTGAPVPATFDAVIMQEHVDREGETIRVSRRPSPGENIRRLGEDIQPGDTLLSKGTCLNAPCVAVAASTGAENLLVKRKARVAFFSTGSELRQPGEPLAPGEIYNSNRYLLSALLTSPTVDALDLGSIPDTPDDLAETLSRAVQASDVVITTGGVSVGEEDHMPAVLKTVGGDIHVMKVAMKPGKPVVIGTVGKTVYVGLPGNPVAAFITYRLIAKPIIDKITGRPEAPEQSTLVRVNFERNRRPARREYLPVKIEHRREDGAPCLTMLGRGGSAALLPIAMADGLAIIEPGAGAVMPGETVPFIAMNA